MSASTTVERLREVIAGTVGIDAHQLRHRVGSIVVALSEDPSCSPLLLRLPSNAMALFVPGNIERDDATIFLADRIPAGIEEQVVLREMVRLHGRKVCAKDWELITNEPERWDTWGRQNVEGLIYDSVSDRIAKSKMYQLPTEKETRFIFSVQEAVKRGVEPSEKGIGAAGWLHAVFDTVRESVHQLMGYDLDDHGPQDFVKLLQVGSPFSAEVDAMNRAKRSEFLRQQLLASRAERMAVLDAKYDSASGQPSAAPPVTPEPPGAAAESDYVGALRQRIAELEAQLADAKSAIASMVEQGADGRWFMDGYRGDEVTSMVNKALNPPSINSSLWNIKGLVGDEAQRTVPRYELEEIEAAAYAGLETATGTALEREALKEILSSVHSAMDGGVSLVAGEVSALVKKGLPFESEPVPAPGTPERDDSPAP